MHAPPDVTVYFHLTAPILSTSANIRFLFSCNKMENKTISKSFMSAYLSAVGQIHKTLIDTRI